MRGGSPPPRSAAPPRQRRPRQTTASSAAGTSSRLRSSGTRCSRGSPRSRGGQDRCRRSGSSPASGSAACSSSIPRCSPSTCRRKRGRFLVFLDFFWPVGLLLATGLSWVFLVQVGGDWGWRYLFLAAAFPAFLAFVARLTLPEPVLPRPARPYARGGRRASPDHRPRVDPDTLEAPIETRSSMRELVSKKLAAPPR